MDGLNIKVKTTDGQEEVFTLRPKSIVAFEQKYNKGFAKLLTKIGTYLLPCMVSHEGRWQGSKAFW
jgi:hypothetical protein